MIGHDLPKHFVASGYIVDRGRVLLIKHRKIKLWLPPGGHIEEDEDPVEALQREVREETGLSVGVSAHGNLNDGATPDVRLIPLPHHIQIERIAEGPHEHIDLVYYCKVTSGRMIMNEESTDIHWFSRKELITEGLDRNVRHFASQAIERSGVRGSGRHSRRSSHDPSTRRGRLGEGNV